MGEREQCVREMSVTLISREMGLMSGRGAGVYKYADTVRDFYHFTHFRRRGRTTEEGALTVLRDESCAYAHFYRFTPKPAHFYRTSQIEPPPYCMIRAGGAVRVRPCTAVTLTGRPLRATYIQYCE